MKSQVMDPVVPIVKSCRVCQFSQFESVLSLGIQFISDFVSSNAETPKAPLDLIRCRRCGLVQLKHTFPRGSLYSHYWYKSGISPTMRTALAELVAKTSQIAEPKANDIVVDIGCNDGTLLRSYTVPGLFRVGFEPAENLIPEAQRGNDWIFNDFFNSNLFEQKFGAKKAKIVSSVAMFYDLEDPNRFVSDIGNILSRNGVWVVQQNYLATMIEQNGFDNIGHEHLEYYSLDTMRYLVEKHDMEIFESETNDVNGGSFRTFIGFKGQHPIHHSVKQMQDHEARIGLDKPSTYARFASNIAEVGAQIHDFVSSQVKSGKIVYAYGASNRGNTILQYCRLDHSLIQKAADANPDKWGRKTAGTLIPIVSKEEARKDSPDYFLILPHHFLNEIKRQEFNYLQRGGKFIVPLPRFQIVD